MTNNPPSAQIKPGEYGFPLKCNFAFFFGLIDEQFWAKRASPKSPELTANYCQSSSL